MLVFTPNHPTAGFIPYPGGKVESAAYAPLMLELAEQDVLCVLIEMPLNLAVLDSKAADGVLNLEKYQKYLANLPENTTETIIEGGNHAGFGSYGKQEGDGEASISGSEQIHKTVELLLDFFAA
ncbi:MAG: hypothetical protein IJ468_01310 [Lachnospiraceae bacterium]|nr:hypothetical protein [Lachnospiraceae bacterium]